MRRQECTLERQYLGFWGTLVVSATKGLLALGDQWGGTRDAGHPAASRAVPNHRPIQPRTANCGPVRSVGQEGGGYSEAPGPQGDCLVLAHKSLMTLL